MSLKKRYLFKLLTNLTGFAIGLVTQSIVPRSLGPIAYGNFSFLTSFFQQVAGLFNLNSSTAYYTKLSKKQDDRSLVGFYFIVILMIAAGLLIVFSVPFFTGLNTFVWPGQQWVYVGLAVVWAFFTFYSTVLNDMADAYALTVRSESLKMIIKLLGFVIILMMFWQKWFSLRNYFFYQLSILAITVLLLSMLIKRSKMPLFGDYSPSSSETSIYRKEFAAFCLPLIVFVGLSIFEQIADRWFLQMFSGSVKQGYYALAYQIGAICFLFTSAFIPLVLREQSISFGKNDHQALRYIFMRFIPMLYTLTAFFCCFIVIEARQVLHFFGGSAYAGALVPLMIMCLFPIHQTYGQLNTNMFFATERVKTYRNIGLVFIAIGLPTTLFLLGPRTYGCLQLGAMGLAVKMVVINILSTNVQLWFNTRYLGLSYKELLIHQILTVAVLLVLAWGTSLGIRYVVNDNHYIVQFVLSGMMYSMLAGILAFMVPGIFKVQRSDFIRFYEFFRRKWAAQTS